MNRYTGGNPNLYLDYAGVMLVLFGLFAGFMINVYFFGISVVGLVAIFINYFLKKCFS